MLTITQLRSGLHHQLHPGDLHLLHLLHHHHHDLKCVGLGVDCGRAERRLINDLMMFYQKLERPVVNESDAIQLKFGLTLQQIMNVVGC